MLSTIRGYKTTNDQDIDVKGKTDNYQWSSFSDKKQTYIRAKLVSVETQISHSETLDPEEGHFQREQINYSYLLTFQEGLELKTYLFNQKPTDLGQYYLYTTRNNIMISCYHSEKGFENNIKNENAKLNFILNLLLPLFGVYYSANIVFFNFSFSFTITMAALFLSSLGLKYLINKKKSNLANRIIEKLKKDKP